MGRKGFIIILLICLVIILVGIPLTPSIVSLQDSQTAPEEIEINGAEYALETYLQRDLMPICPPDGRPLVALVKVEAPGETAISSKIDATRLWVAKGTEIWETELASKEVSTIGDTLEKVGRNGPKWEPEITVDVVVKIIDLKSGKSYLLKASNQYIYRTL
jgi:hypothetical protein